MGEIREKLRQFIESKKDKGITQASLARKMGCVSSQINHLLSGERELSEKWIIKFCDALEITISDLDWKKDEVGIAEHVELYRKLRYILTRTKRSEKVIRAAIDAAFKEVKEDESKNNRSP